MHPAENDPSDLRIAPHPDLRGTYRLTASLRLPLPPERIFDFFADAHNLQSLTPPWLHFSVLTPPPIDMHAGTLIDYRLRVHGLPLRWRSEITAWEPPFRFVDRQVRGPYRLWLHEHTFQRDGTGTIAQDQVDYAVPGGALVHRLFVRRDIERIFAFRRAALLAHFPSSVVECAELK